MIESWTPCHPEFLIGSQPEQHPILKGRQVSQQADDPYRSRRSQPDRAFSSLVGARALPRGSRRPAVYIASSGQSSAPSQNVGRSHRRPATHVEVEDLSFTAHQYHCKNDRAHTRPATHGRERESCPDGAYHPLGCTAALVRGLRRLPVFIASSGQRMCPFETAWCEQFSYQARHAWPKQGPGPARGEPHFRRGEMTYGWPAVHLELGTRFSIGRKSTGKW